MADLIHLVNVEGAVYRGDRYLIVKRSPNEAHAADTLSLVGGTIEPKDETSHDVLKATLRREITEEVGVQVDSIQYVSSNVFDTDAGEHVLNIVFLCRYADGIATAADPNEVEEVHWMTAQDIINHPKAPPWTRKHIQQCEDQRQLLIP